MTLPVNIEALINGNVVENDRIEFKRDLTDDLDIEKLVNNGLHEYN